MSKAGPLAALLSCLLVAACQASTGNDRPAAGTPPSTAAVPQSQAPSQAPDAAQVALLPPSQPPTGTAPRPKSKEVVVAVMPPTPPMPEPVEPEPIASIRGIPADYRCNDYPREAGLVLLVVDRRSLRSPTIARRADAAIDRLMTVLKPYQRLEAFVITDNVVHRDVLLTACRPGARGITGLLKGALDRRRTKAVTDREESDFVSEVTNALKTQLAAIARSERNRRPSSRGSALIDSLAAVSRGEADGEIRAVVIISDMLDGVSVKLSPDAPLDDYALQMSLKAARVDVGPARLSGAEIHVFGFGAFLDARQREGQMETATRNSIERFWRTYFSAAGAVEPNFKY